VPARTVPRTRDRGVTDVPRLFSPGNCRLTVVRRIDTRAVDVLHADSRLRRDDGFAGV